MLNGILYSDIRGGGGGEAIICFGYHEKCIYLDTKLFVALT